MSLRDAANVTFAAEPFSGFAEMHTLAAHRHHTAFRADRNYFEANPHLHHAVRRALCELDSLAELGDWPPPPLYVFVTKINDDTHTVEGMFRGVPHWREIYCGNFRYADVKTNRQAFELMHACRCIGGMDATARGQFDRHVQHVSLARAFAATIGNVGKAN